MGWQIFYWYEKKYREIVIASLNDNLCLFIKKSIFFLSRDRLNFGEIHFYLIKFLFFVIFFNEVCLQNFLQVN